MMVDDSARWAEGDLEARVRQLEEALGIVQSDASIRNLPYGTLKQPASITSIISIGGTGGCYPAGALNQMVSRASQGIVANRLYAIPFYLPKPATASQISIGVQVAVSGLARLGIYEDRGEDLLRPGRLLLDAGEVSTTSTGNKTIAIKRELPRGLLWLALVANAAPSLQAITGQGWAPLGYDAGGVNAYAYVYVAFTYAALPNPFPSGATEAAASCPMVLLKFS